MGPTNNDMAVSCHGEEEVQGGCSEGPATNTEEETGSDSEDISGTILERGGERGNGTLARDRTVEM